MPSVLILWKIHAAAVCKVDADATPEVRKLLEPPIRFVWIHAVAAADIVHCRTGVTVISQVGRLHPCAGAPAIIDLIIALIIARFLALALAGKLAATLTAAL